MTSTIFALSSGRPPAGIAVVRISGPAAFATLTELTGTPIPPLRMLVLRRLVDPRDAVVLDQALVVAFAAPASATGDDLVELHLHGGSAVVTGVLGVLSAMPGLVLAKPGEFTRRAFDNGKLDLSQVEGLADLIAAGTEAQRRQALDHAGGLLRERVAHWRRTLIEVRADVEATLDFAEEDEVAYGVTAGDRTRLADLQAQLAAALADSKRGERLREGLTVAITGPVNVGKSSLINAIAQREVAIVTAFPGTTRDVLEVQLDLGGVSVMLLDTAGLRDTVDPVEAEGIRRAVVRAAAADLVLALGEAPDRGEFLRVVSKSDLSPVGGGWRDGALHLSGLTRDGVDLLVTWLTAWAEKKARPGEPAIISRERHRMAIELAIGELASALVTTDAVLAAEHLRQTTDCLDSLIGGIANDDVLDAVFARFCLGK